MRRIVVVTLLSIVAGCKDKPAEATSGDVTLTPRSFHVKAADNADPAWTPPSGRRFVSVRTDVLMNTCEPPVLKSEGAELASSGYGRFPATAGAFGDKKPSAGTLAETELNECAAGKTTVVAELVFLVPDNMDVASASLSLRGATAPLSGATKM